MISRQYLTRKSLKKTHQRLARLLVQPGKEAAGKVLLAEDSWTWRPPASDHDVVIRYGNEPTGIRVEAVCMDTSVATIDLFESLVCASGVLVRSEGLVAFDPIKIPPTWANYSSELMPTTIIMPRWEGMHDQEKAYATCLFDCVRLEHMLRKYVSGDLFHAASFGVADESAEARSEEAEFAPNMEKPAAKITLGQVAWEFACQPEHADLLLGMGCQQDIIKLVGFRNYLIHGDAVHRYPTNKLRKRFVRLQQVLYHLKRWPQSLRLHRALAGLIEKSHIQTERIGPPAPPSHILIAARKGVLAELTLGLDGPAVSLLTLAVDMLVKPDQGHAPAQMDELASKLESLAGAMRS